MASHGYMRITGKRQGLICAGCSNVTSLGNKCQISHEDEIMVLAYSHNMTTGNDGSVSGGRGQHLPIMITKYIDKSSPLLASTKPPLRAARINIIQYNSPARKSPTSASRFPIAFTSMTANPKRL